MIKDWPIKSIWGEETKRGGIPSTPTDDVIILADLEGKFKLETEEALYWFG